MAIQRKSIKQVNLKSNRVPLYLQEQLSEFDFYYNFSLTQLMNEYESEYIKFDNATGEYITFVKPDDEKYPLFRCFLEDRNGEFEHILAVVSTDSQRLWGFLSPFQREQVKRLRSILKHMIGLYRGFVSTTFYQ